MQSPVQMHKGGPCLCKCSSLGRHSLSLLPAQISQHVTGQAGFWRTNVTVYLIPHPKGMSLKACTVVTYEVFQVPLLHSRNEGAGVLGFQSASELAIPLLKLPW